MKEHVTVVPADGLIICDGVALSCEFVPHTDHLHALQWHNGQGHIELKKEGTMMNREIVSYETEVQPYVECWQARFDTLNTASGNVPEETEEPGAAVSPAPAARPLSGKTTGTAREAAPETVPGKDPFAGKPVYRYGTARSAGDGNGLAETFSAGSPALPGNPGVLQDGSPAAGRPSSPAIVASGRDGTIWYRKWSDGWLEQGGQPAIAPRGTAAVRFPAVFETVLHIGITPCYYTGEQNHAASIGLTGQTSSGFTACQCSEKKGCHWNGFVWYACGDSA